MDQIEERQIEKWKDMKVWKKSRLNREMICKIWKKRGKRYEISGRNSEKIRKIQKKLWKDMENMEERQVE